MKLVADTGPIIALAKIGKLYWLEQLVDQVMIPPMVYKELLGKIGPEADVIENSLKSFIKISDLPRVEAEIQSVVSNLDEGEKQAIILAYHNLNDILLLIDDRAGREIAYKLQIPITGLLGMFIKLKEKGKIRHVGSMIEQLRQNGYWLSDEIVESAKKMAGE